MIPPYFEDRRMAELDELCSFGLGDIRHGPRRGRPRIHESDTCTIEGCKRKLTARGMCMSHYMKQRKYGDPLAVRQRGAKKKPAVPCSEPGCEGKAICKGICRKHYDRRRQEEKAIL
jgi:hypothetical protein